jgi:hypothetical protein
LRMHPVIRFEVLTGKGHQRAIARMIQGLDAGNPLRQFRTLLLNVVFQLGLGIGRAGNQKRARVRERFEDAVKEFLVYLKMAAAGGVGLVLQVMSGEMRMKDDSLRIAGVEMKDFRLAMIDPDNRVEVRAHDNPRMSLWKFSLYPDARLVFPHNPLQMLRSVPTRYQSCIYIACRMVHSLGLGRIRRICSHQQEGLV